LSPDQITSLAPSPATLKRAQTLAVPRKWTELGQFEGFLWGKCKGSGSKTYEVMVDTSEFASKCNCPSREFPCKHGLGLMLIFVKNPGELPEGKVPEWVEEWKGKREKKRERVSESVSVEKEKKTHSSDDRLEKRITRMQLGMRELETWLQDVLHQGLAELSQQPFEYFESVAARLVDAQAPGLANLVRALPASMLGEAWQERCLNQIGHIYLLLKAFQKLDRWPKDFQEELKSLAGINVKKEVLESQTGISDTWEVVGKRQESQDRLEMQRTWLWGHHSKQFALLLDFSFGGNRFTYNYQPGTAVEGEIVFYPGIIPQRAHLKLPVKVKPGEGILDLGMPFHAFQQVFAEALSISPFVSTYPAWLSGVSVVPAQEDIVLLSDENKEISLHPAFQRSWEILAISGGQPLSIFGEWHAQKLLPLGVLAPDYRWINLS
jgi:hypothetical protein